jgi:ATP-dependent protease ClpP protease subunit
MSGGFIMDWKHLWDTIRDPMYYVAIALLVVIFMLVWFKGSEAATIFSDGDKMITIDGGLYPGDAARLTRALGEIRILWPTDVLEIVIDSRGGDADVAQNMMYILKRWSQEHDTMIRTICYSRAQSGGALIFLMGDERWVGDLAVVMIHEVWFAYAGGHYTTQEMLDMDQLTPNGAKATIAFNALMYQIVKEKTTVPPQLIKDEYTFTAGEAYHYNIATHYKPF